MPGTAVVTINGNEWLVNVANTTAELIQGLSGVASIPVGTGMLFVLPARQVATIQTEQMLFPIDIIFIKDGIVLSIAQNISPGYLVEEATPCDMFLEVNANEAALVEVEDVVILTDYSIIAPAFDIGTIITSITPLVVLALLFPMLSGMLKGVTGSSPKQLSSGNPNGAYPVHCVACGWTGSRAYGPLKPCPKCGGVVVWTFTGRTKPPKKVTVTCPICSKVIVIEEYNRVTGTEALRKHIEEKHREQSSNTEYYWEIFDVETGEIMQKHTPYASISKVYRSARGFQSRRSGKDKENLVVIRIYDDPNMEEWGKTIKYVMESGMHRGIPILIGKTPLQEAALDRLWPYMIKEIHSDGDLTVMSSGKKYVVTTEGGVFAEEDIIPAGDRMIEIPLTKPPLPGSSKEQIERMAKEGYEWSAVDDWVTRQVGYDKEVLDWAREIYNKAKLEEEPHSIHGEPPFKKEFDLTKGDRVRITMPAQEPFPAGWAEGTVMDAHFYGESDGWFIEFDKDKVSPGWQTGYGYWKQGVDGGYVEKLVGESTWQEGEWLHVTCGSTHIKGKKVNGAIDTEVITKGTLEDFEGAMSIIRTRLLGERHSIHGEPRRRLVEQYGSWAVGRAEAICPENDVPCVTREAERLLETLRARYGEEAVEYVTITDAGATVFHTGDTVSIVALERENKRVRELGEKEATYKT